jgi:hypothetical protein
MSDRMVVVLVLDSDEEPDYEDTTIALEALRGLVGQHLGKWQATAGWLGTDRVDEVIAAIGPVGEAGLDLLGRTRSKLRQR